MITTSAARAHQYSLSVSKIDPPGSSAGAVVATAFFGVAGGVASAAGGGVACAGSSACGGVAAASGCPAVAAGGGVASATGGGVAGAGAAAPGAGAPCLAASFDCSSASSALRISRRRFCSLSCPSRS